MFKNHNSKTKKNIKTYTLTCVFDMILKRGDNFIADSLRTTITSAELAPEVKNTISHRAKALTALLEELKVC
jgi:hypothetical protein